MGEGVLIGRSRRWPDRSPARLVLAAALLAAAVVACGPSLPSATDPGSSKNPETAPPAASTGPAATPAADVPGRPYDGPALLALMRAQQRPALDPSLVTDAVAAAMAEQVWTYDGRPYAHVLFEATCEGPTCTLGLTGLPSFAIDPTFTDVYRWVVEPGTATLQPEGGWPSLSGYPHELDPELAAEAQRLDATGRLEGLQLSSARWVPDADSRLFELQFDNGLDPSSAVSVRLDRAAGTLNEVQR